MKYFILLAILTCSSPDLKIDKPVDYSDTIKRAEEKPNDPTIQKEVVTDLKKCQAYSQATYDAYIQCKKNSDELSANLDKEKLSHKKDISAWEEKEKEYETQLDEFWSRPQKKIALFGGIGLVVAALAYLIFANFGKILELYGKLKP